MIETTDSDFNPTMAAYKTFDQILECVKSSNLNFCLQLSPFSANISIKKTAVKDKSGVPLTPRLHVPDLRDKHDLEKIELIKKVNDLEMVNSDLQLRLTQSIRDGDQAHETIRQLENNLNIKQENIDTKENDLEIQIQKKTSEISNLHDVNKELQKQAKTLETLLLEKKTEIQNLQQSLQNSRCAAKKLNKELNENRHIHEKETKNIVKNFRSEIKAWKKDLGRERAEKIKIERKLATLDDLVKKSKSKESVTCQTPGCTDVPYLVTEPLPPIFGSQLCYRSKSISLAKSMPNLSVLSWVKVTEDNLVVYAAE